MLFVDQPELLPTFRRGERPALEAVYRRYVADVTRLFELGFRTGEPPSYVAGITDRAALRDAVQEVFVRAFQAGARQRYDPSRPYRPYLLRIARNLRIDQLRSRGREQPWSALAQDLPDIDQLIEAEPSELPLGAEGAQQKREWEALQRLTHDYVSGLSGTLRRFVELRFVEERSQHEVAESMRVTRRQTRTWEEQILAQLKRHLAGR